ncbi:MAG: hypothetical protein KatS3mg126_2496 [Lysobacteraceae bacterium]|nr:MAG: hypothetical protein KatS3mg126_2496 [Xanthomonadaceae bacterium]
MRIELGGAVDAGRVPELWARHRAAGAVEAIDLSAVTRLDSAGVALIRQLQRRSRAAGGSTRLLHVPADYRQLLEAHRLAPLGDDDG